MNLLPSRSSFISLVSGHANRMYRIFVIAGCLAGADASAQLAMWDIDGTRANVNNPRAATPLDPNLAGATLYHGGGTAATGGLDFFGGTNFFDTTLANAISNNRYFGFTLSPSDGFSYSVSSISVNLHVNYTGTMAIVLMSSATSFGTTSGLWSGSVSNSTSTSQSISLSAVSALQNLTTATEFRIYGYVTSGSGGQMRIFDGAGSDLSVFGATAVSSVVPEPSSYATFVGLGALGFAAWRRRRRTTGA